MIWSLCAEGADPPVSDILETALPPDIACVGDSNPMLTVQELMETITRPLPLGDEDTGLPGRTTGSQQWREERGETGGQSMTM